MWRRILRDVAANWELDERELRALELACRCADDEAAVEKAVAVDGYVVVGSKGQLRPHPGLDMLVRLRTLEASLLRPLELAPPAAKTPTQKRAQKATVTRWDRQARTKGAA